MTEKNPFKSVERCLKTNQYRTVLLALLNDKGNRIMQPYNSDLNHAWYLVGSVFYKQERFYKALLSFKKSYYHWKKDIAAIRAIGNCYSEIGNPKLAKYYFIKAMDLSGTQYKDLNILIYNLGNAYFDLRKYDLAIVEYKKVNKFDEETYQLAQKNIEHAETQIKTAAKPKKEKGG